MSSVNMISIPQNLDSTIGTANMVGVVLSTITYGVHFTLFAFLIRLHIDRSPYVIRSRRPPRPNWWHMAYATLLFLLATAGICLQTWLNHRAFIEHRHFPGGPLAYMVAKVRDPANLAVTGVYVVLNWCADGMLLYRVFVLYGSTKYVLAACIVTITSLIVTGSVIFPNIAMLSINLWTDTSAIPSLTYLTFSLSIHVILTFVIVLRLLYFRYRIHNALGDSGRIYCSIVTMFVESASLYTIVATTCVVACGVNSPVQNALLPMLGQVQAIGPLLIAIRVLECRVVSPETYPASMPSAIAFSQSRTNSFSSFGKTLSVEEEEGLLPPYPQYCRSRPASVMYEKRRSLEFCSVPSELDIHSPCPYPISDLANAKWENGG